MIARKLAAYVAAAGLLLTLGAVSASATAITLGTSAQTISIALSGVDTFTVNFANPVSGNTTPSGGYSFNNVGPLVFGPPASAGSGAAYSSGTAGTLTLGGGSPLALTWTLLDGDGSGYTLSFTTPLSGVLDEIFLNPPASGPASFTALLGDPVGTAVSTTISSGEVATPEPVSMVLMGTFLSLAGLLLGRKRVMA